MRRRLGLWAFLVSAVLLVLAVLRIYYFVPEQALAGLRALYAWRAGVSTERVTLADGYELSMYVGGKGRHLLLLHGYGDSRISFLQAARQLTDGFRVILPNWPGHGDTVQDPARNYGIRAQVETLERLRKKLGLKRPILVGNSMGGHIAAAYALRYPRHVCGLVLLDPAGLRVDQAVPYKPEAKPLLNDADFDAYLDRAFARRPWVPYPFRRYFLKRSKEGFAWSERLRRDIRRGRDYILNGRLRGLKAPTLIIWGKQDGIVRVVHAKHWQRGIPQARVEIWDPMGHGPQYEDPQRTGIAIRDFARRLANNPRCD